MTSSDIYAKWDAFRASLKPGMAVVWQHEELPSERVRIVAIGARTPHVNEASDRLWVVEPMVPSGPLDLHEVWATELSPLDEATAATAALDQSGLAGL